MAQRVDNPEPTETPRVLRPAPSSDPTIEALDALRAVLDDVARDHQILLAKVVELRSARLSGSQWSEILGDEEGVPVVVMVSQLLARISGASGVLRKELVESLRREGVSIPAIAALFGVSHQRVSNLLRRK